MFGGTPEDFDKDRIATLKREFVEEANTTLKDPIYLVGYQKSKVMATDRLMPNLEWLRS